MPKRLKSLPWGLWACPLCVQHQLSLRLDGRKRPIRKLCNGTKRWLYSVHWVGALARLDWTYFTNLADRFVPEILRKWPNAAKDDERRCTYLKLFDALSHTSAELEDVAEVDDDDRNLPLSTSSSEPSESNPEPSAPWPRGGARTRPRFGTKSRKKQAGRYAM
jgi:hypothetical protein